MRRPTPNNSAPSGRDADADYYEDRYLELDQSGRL